MRMQSVKSGDLSCGSAWSYASSSIALGPVLPTLLSSVTRFLIVRAIGRLYYLWCNLIGCSSPMTRIWNLVGSISSCMHFHLVAKQFELPNMRRTGPFDVY